MPRRRRETLLQRQRRLRNMEQAKKNASKKLPSRGGSTGNSLRAKAQRGATRHRMAGKQAETFARGVSQMLKRGAARDKLDKAAKGTRGSGTRTAGAGGGLAKRLSSAVTKTGNKSGGLSQRGGRLARRGTGINRSDIQRVKVKDLGSTPKSKIKGGANKALKAGNKGGALARTAGKLAGKAGKFLGAVGAAAAIGSEIKKIKDVNKYTFGRIGKDPKLSSKATAPNRAERAGRSGPKKVSYPVQKGSVTPKKVKYPTAAETRAAETRRKTAEAERRKNTKKTDKPKITAPPTKQKQTGDRDKDMATWAKANRKMIEKVGTKAQRAILARVDAQEKKKKRPNMSGTLPSNRTTA